MTANYFVTGAFGCIGSWTAHHLVKSGKNVIAFDIVDTGHRLDYLLTPEEQSTMTIVKGDLSDFDQVKWALDTHAITHIIHLAALQVPFCRDDPVRGAQVNVVGTVNIFEAARQLGIKHLTYASSIAVYGLPDDYPPGPIQHNALPAPRTLYGVYKVANEGTAQIYWQDHQLSSIALRPYTIYGVGRDQGLTSDPTKAMLAAAIGREFNINLGGEIQFQLASDVAQQFIHAAENPTDGAHGFNLSGETVTIPEVIAHIKSVKPDAKITFTDQPLPFPNSFDDTPIKQHSDQIYDTPLADGIQQTITLFEQLIAAGRLQVE
jgi:nucleoside-diphosphate-sugar epimerase